MENRRPKNRIRSIFIWLGWALLIQFILLNISAASYAYKLTHLLKAENGINSTPPSNNIFAKTWRLFTGPDSYRRAENTIPDFPFATIYLKTSSDIPIEGWYSKTDSIARGTVILVHGLNGNKGMLLKEAAAFRVLGYNVMLFDARNHGNSGGDKTTMGYKETEEIKLAYEYIKSKGENTIVLWGASLGAVEVVKAVSDYDLHLSAIIIEMPFLSLRSHFEWRAHSLNFPAEPFGILVSFWVGAENGFNGWGLRTDKYARKLNCPVLLQYGKKDGLVKESETTEIYDAITTEKKLVMYDNAGHESLLANDPVTWMNEMKTFLK